MVIAHNKKVGGASLTKVPHKPEYLKPSDFDDIPDTRNSRYAIEPFPYPVQRFNPDDYEREQKHFSVPLQIVGSPRMTRGDRALYRPCVRNYFEFRNKLKAIVGDHQCPGELIWKAWIPMPKSWSKKKQKELEGQPCEGGSDLDNYCKSIFDGLFEQDKKIWRSSQEKFWCREGKASIALTFVYWKKKI
jgi:Holliday junction resolvase RusA-like endonuclease